MADSHKESESWTNVSRSSSLDLPGDKTNEADTYISEGSGDEAISPLKDSHIVKEKARAPSRRISLDSKESGEERDPQGPGSRQAENASPHPEGSNPVGIHSHHLELVRLRA